MAARNLTAMLGLGLAVTLMACSSPTGSKLTLTGNTGRAIMASASTTQLGYGNGSFGAGLAQQTGVSGLVNMPGNSTTSATPAPTYRLALTLTYKGKTPGDVGADSRLINPSLEVRLAPSQITMHRTSVQYLHEDGLVTFQNLPTDLYHVIYDDTQHGSPLISNAQPDSNGIQRLDQLGFFVSDPIRIHEFTKPRTGDYTYALDLHWPTQAFPLLANTNYTDTTHRNGEYYTYDDEFSLKAREFVGLLPGQTPAAGLLAEYRIVVCTNDGFFTRLWESAWHLPNTATNDPAKYGTVKVCWNGYTSEGTGPGDAPDEKYTSGNRYLPAADYLWAIEFRKAGGVFPERSPNARYYLNEFIPNFYGGSQWFRLRLLQGTKKDLSTPSASPSAWVSPTPASF